MSWMEKVYETIIEAVDVGIHAVDKYGKTIIYNKKMREIESMPASDVMNRNVREVFQFNDNQTSTLLQSLSDKERIINVKQSYLNNRGIEITTVNQTIPIEQNGEVCAAVEIATDISKMSRLMQQKVQYEHEPYTFDKIIGNSPVLLDIIDIAKRATRTTSNVLIIGETGTGKELFAQSIHTDSNRINGPFIAQNCAAIPDTLMESMLFGTTKGAFTGAVDSPGLFEQASGGTLLLDELNSLNLGLQAKLLRVLQEKKVRRIGGKTDLPVDVRVIATMNEDPVDLISQNRLRKDLYYRLAVITIAIPPLRERKEDIPVLVHHFIQKYNRLFQMNVLDYTPEVEQLLYQHDWPGNARELEHVIEAAMNLIQYETTLAYEHLPYHYRKRMQFAPREQTLHVELEGTLAEQLAMYEKQIIQQALQAHHGHITNAAAQLGLSRQSLQYRMKKCNLREG